MKSFCVIGLGKFGISLATNLAEQGNQVMIIDTDEDKVTALADIVTNAVIGDPTNEAVLKSSGVADYDCAIICFSGNINQNVLLAIMLKEAGVKSVIARYANEGHRKVLTHIGIDGVICPENDMGEKLAYMLTKEGVTEFAEFTGYKLVEIKVPDDWVGMSIIELDVRRKYGINIIAVSPKAGGRADVTPSPMRVFREGERMSVIGSDKNIEKLMRKI